MFHPSMTRWFRLLLLRRRALVLGTLLLKTIQ